MTFLPNYKQLYKTKDDAILGILNSFINVPNAADKDGKIVFLLGKNVLKITPNKKKKKEDDQE